MPTKKKVAKKVVKYKSHIRREKVQKEEPIPTPFSVAKSSPIKVRVIEKFSFPQAMEHVINNKKIRRAEWPEIEFGCLHNGFLCIFRVKDSETAPAFHSWLVSDGDMLEGDWQLA